MEKEKILNTIQEVKNSINEFEETLKQCENIEGIEEYETNLNELKRVFNLFLESNRIRVKDSLAIILGWRDIKDFEGLYQVNAKGEIRSLQGKEPKILKPYKNNKGYLRVDLRKNNERYPKKVHRLVAEAFILNPDNKPQVNHINGDKTDNRYFNLEWVNNRENIKHAINTGLKFSNDILDTRPCICLNNGAIYPSINIASEVFGLNPKDIWKNCNEKIEFVEVEAEKNKYYFQYAIIVDNVENKIKNPFNLASERV